MSVDHVCEDNYRKYRLQTIIAFVLLLAGLIAGQVADSRYNRNARSAIVKSSRTVIVEGCNRDFRTISQVRGVLIASRKHSKEELEHGTITQTEYEDNLRFYAQQLKNLKLPDCLEARELITADPDKSFPEPEPLRP